MAPKTPHEFSSFETPEGKEKRGEPKAGPKRLQEASKRLQEGPKRPQEAPQRAPRGPRRAIRGPHEAPKRTSRGSERKVRRLTVVMFPELGD